MKVQCTIAKMKPDKLTVTTSAYAFGYFLSVLLLKYLLYDNGFEFSNILLVVGLIYTRFYLFGQESTRLREGACLILFVLFSKNLLDVGNVFLLLGVACMREQFESHDDIKKEIASFVCGLIYLLMGWFSVGKVLVIYFLMMYYYLIIRFFMTICVFSIIAAGVLDQSVKKLRDETNEANKKCDDVTTSEQKYQF